MNTESKQKNLKWKFINAVKVKSLESSVLMKTVTICNTNSSALIDIIVVD